MTRHLKPSGAHAARLVIVIATAAACISACKSEAPKEKPKVTVAPTGHATEAEVTRACGIQCHRLPPPSVLPKSKWRAEILKMCDEIMNEGGVVNGVNIEDCFTFYESHAPDSIPISNVDARPGIGPIAMRKFGMYCSTYPRVSPGGPPPKETTPELANVTWGKLRADDKLPKLVASDMVNGVIVVFDPMHPDSSGKIVAEIANPAHTTVVDLNKDGIPDLLVANMGSPQPTNLEFGTVEWLRGRPDGGYDKFTLLQHLARTTDVEAADFDGDGDLDLVVTCFGLTRVGQIIYAENKTTDWNNPVFEPRMIDSRPGGIHVPICDLNHDGKPDFVALIAQQYELIVAYTNLGGARFKQDTIFIGPHPHYGSSGIQMVDLDGDGDLDVLYTNGDVLDDGVLQPYHGAQWLENTGTFPWVHHELTHLNGCERAVAVDLDGDGDLDIVASSFLVEVPLAQRKQLGLESMIWLENNGHGVFTRHSLEMYNTGHASIDVADFDGDGRPDLAASNFCAGPAAYEEHPFPIVTLWHNETPRRSRRR